MIARFSLRRLVHGGVALAFALTLFINVAILVVPIYDMQLYDRVLMSRNMDTLALLSVACATGLLFYGAIDYLRSASFLAIAETIGRRLHGPALEQGIRRAATGDRAVGPQLARDVDDIRSVLSSGAIAVPLDALCAPMFVVVLFMLHPAFAWLAVGGIAGLILTNLLAELVIGPLLHEAQNDRRAADNALSRSVGDTDLTEGLGMLPAIGRLWCERNGAAVAALSRVVARAHAVGALSHTFRMILQAGVMALGAVLIIRGHTTPGSLMGANLLVNKCLGPFDHIVENCRSWMKTRAAWRRIAALRDPEMVAPEIAAQKTATIEPGLSVQELGFRLPGGEPLLDGVDFRLEAGCFALLKGENGSGKTTLMRMLAGIAAPTTGTMTLDGVKLRASLHTGYLPQSVSLLDGTIAENIGRFEHPLETVVQAARMADVHELIGRLSRGYDTVLSNNGSPLSGGIRQRIGLARALCGGPKLLLLDEPDANLDTSGTEALITAIRAACLQGCIAIVISHRARLAEAANVVLEIERGRLVQQAARPVQRAVRQLETA